MDTRRSSRSVSSQVLGFFGWLSVVLLTGAVGAIASVDAAAFYAQLAKPPWAPPASVFGPVWTALYVLMAVSAWMVWRVRDFDTRKALWLFVTQLFVNGLWSWLFFAWHRGALAFADVVALLVLIIATIVEFWRVQRLAAMILLPYWLWVGFASVLTWAVWRGNPLAL